MESQVLLENGKPKKKSEAVLYLSVYETGLTYIPAENLIAKHNLFMRRTSQA